MRKISRAKLTGIFFLMLLFLSHCIATPTAPSGTSTAIDISTVTSRVTIEPTPTSKTTVSSTISSPVDTSSWVSHRITDIGVELLLPPGWKTLRGEGFYFARPASVQSEIDSAAFALVLGYRRDDLPQALPALTEILAPRLGENEPNPLTTQPVTLGGHAGIAFLGFQNLCMEIFVPAEGIIHQVTVASYFCEGEPGKRYLTPEGQTVLDSIQFFPPTWR
jgi:hypothetical protein